MSRFAVFALLAALVAVALAQQQPPPPPFLQGQPPAVIASFNKILEKGHSMTDKQLDEEVEKWVGTQAAAVKTKYTQFKNELKGHQDGAEKAHQAAIAKFSPEAKAADAKLSSIANDASKTSQQKNAEIEKFVSSLPANVRKEIEDAMQG
ncbi:Surface-associated antigen 2 [Aphelenchoides fujianensis]|nr:Surface-associated antigen 2 [Aphelenchoides fujianensis]